MQCFWCSLVHIKVIISNRLTIETVTVRNICEANREEAMSSHGGKLGHPLWLHRASFACCSSKSLFCAGTQFALLKYNVRTIYFVHQGFSYRKSLDFSPFVHPYRNSAHFLTVHRRLWLSEPNPPLAVPPVVGLCVGPIAGTWPLQNGGGDFDTGYLQ